jgi:hypothetical protein
MRRLNALVLRAPVRAPLARVGEALTAHVEGPCALITGLENAARPAVAVSLAPAGGLARSLDTTRKDPGDGSVTWFRMDAGSRAGGLAVDLLCQRAGGRLAAITRPERHVDPKGRANP